MQAPSRVVWGLLLLAAVHCLRERRCTMEAAVGRCEAYVPKSDPLKDDRYERAGSSSFLGGIMLGNYVTREASNNKLKAHCEAVEDGRRHRELLLNLPCRDEAEHTRPKRHLVYGDKKERLAKANYAQRLHPVDRILEQYGAPHGPDAKA